jgi:hypothetical protein
MARQFRDQLEEEAHSLETKMTVDPGIDTSLESRKPAPPAPAAAPPAPASPDASAEPVTPAPYEPSYTNDVEEQFYPPDHHMHSPGEGRQAELDLTTGNVPEQGAEPGPPKTP